MHEHVKVVFITLSYAMFQYGIICAVTKSMYIHFTESSKASVELPPELCLIVMSPISIGTFYSFSFLPSIVHRIESLLIAVNLRKMYVDHCTQNVVIPTIKVLYCYLFLSPWWLIPPLFGLFYQCLLILLKHGILEVFMTFVYRKKIAF